MDRCQSVLCFVGLSHIGNPSGLEESASLLPPFLHTSCAKDSTCVLSAAVPAGSASPGNGGISRVEFFLLGQSNEVFRRGDGLWPALVVGGRRTLLHFLASYCPQTQDANPGDVFG